MGEVSLKLEPLGLPSLEWNYLVQIRFHADGRSFKMFFIQSRKSIRFGFEIEDVLFLFW